MTWKPGDRLPDTPGPDHHRAWAEVLDPHTCSDFCTGERLYTSDTARWPEPFKMHDLDGRFQRTLATEATS